jgi:hypothetical protein
MSHVTGTVQAVSPVITIGPDFGPASGPSNTWIHSFAHTPAPGGTKFVILHFRNASLPANNRLEVDLGYDTDRFTAADGAEFWTRPVNIHVLPGSLVPIRYITDGASSGGVRLDKYGRGERHEEDPDLSANPAFDSFSNCDPFLPSASYVEPDYAKFWLCHTPPGWENVVCVPDGADVRRKVARSVGMIISVHGEHVSTCSVTLISPDRVITAGHCLADPATEVPTSSVTFDYQVNCDNSKPAGYSARFHKVQRFIKWRNAMISGIYYDYCILELQVPPGGLGIPPLQMRPDLPASGEKVFGIHHPNGAVKKLSISHPGYETVLGSSATGIGCDELDVAGGSSGSGLFDTSGRIVGVLSNGVACSLGYFPVSTILQDLTAPPPPLATWDVMIVFDRSGSMSMDAGTGRTKIQEARDAASLFVQLVRAGTGNRVGMVSFSTTASAPADFALANLTAATKTALIGPAPYSGGAVGGLVPGGATTIGGGLEAARLQFPAPGTNPRAILLLTDGLQNTPPMVETVNPTLSGIEINVIGYGTEASLDGKLLTEIATRHNGMYTRATNPLYLKKFFALAFGNIFEAGSLIDPEYFLPEDQNVAQPISFNVCGEENITVVVGWDREDALLLVQVKSPSGTTVHGGSPGVEQSTGRTWTFLRLPLPYNGERDGAWSIEVLRGGGDEEFPPPAVDLHYFVNVIGNGGPRFEQVSINRRYYTGDVINPLVALKYDDGTFPPNAEVQVTIAKPDTSIGNILTQATLRAPMTLDNDTIPARQSTLLALESESGAPVVSYVEDTFDLYDDAAHEDGTFEPDGIFGNPLRDILTVEGNYTFHFKATYGDTCIASREFIWTLHVDAGVDPSNSEVTGNVITTRPDGMCEGRVIIIPRDTHGNHIGPGRLDTIVVSSSSGTTVTGPVQDNGDGSYSVPAIWDCASGHPPSVVIGQPDRPPVVVQEPRPPSQADGTKWKILFWILLILVLILLLLLLLT